MPGWEVWTSLGSRKSVRFFVLFVCLVVCNLCVCVCVWGSKVEE